MKLKVLGMCAIASLLYGENVFVYAMTNQNDQNQVSSPNKSNSQSPQEDQNTAGYMPNKVLPKSWKNAKRNERRRAISIDNSRISQRDQNLYNGANNSVEVNSYSDSNERRRANSIDNSQIPQTDQNLYNGANNSVEVNSYSDSVAHTEPEGESDYYQAIADNVEKQFSEFKNNLEDFKLTANYFFNNMLDNPNLSVTNRKDSAKLFSEAKESILKKGESLEKILNLVSNILKIFEKLKVDEKISEFRAYEAEIKKLLSDINDKKKSLRREKKLEKKLDKQASKQIIGEIDWAAIEKYYEEGLSKFVEKARDFKFKFGTAEFYGKICFEGQDGSLFNPQQNIDPSLKSLCTQIFKVYFPAARDAYFQIKGMSKEAKTKEVLEDFRSKVLALGGSVASLIKQKSDIDKKKRRNEETIKREELGEGNGYEE